MERVYGLAELVIAKQRHGSTGKIPLRFDREVTKFSDLADEHYLTQTTYFRIDVNADVALIEGAQDPLGEANGSDRQ